MKKYEQHKPVWGKLFLAIITLLNLLLTIMLRVSNRQEIVKVLQDEKNEDIITIVKKNQKD